LEARAFLQSLSPIMPSRDIAATEAFYGTLGFRTVYRDTEAYLLMTRDGAEAHFFHAPHHDPLRCDHGAYMRQDDVDALSAEIAELGLPASGVPRFIPAEDKPWGMRELALIDPDGNLIRAGQEIA
jgi:catechol 2,3-dioxygenase-like lactoylglutathione lyase family enzyme